MENQGCKGCKYYNICETHPDNRCRKIIKITKYTFFDPIYGNKTDIIKEHARPFFNNKTGNCEYYERKISLFEKIKSFFKTR
jgi:hypothetical protein